MSWFPALIPALYRMGFVILAKENSLQIYLQFNGLQIKIKKQFDGKWEIAFNHLVGRNKNN